MKNLAGFLLTREQITAIMDALDYATEDKMYESQFETDEEIRKEMREIANVWGKLSSDLWNLIYG